MPRALLRLTRWLGRFCDTIVRCACNSLPSLFLSLLSAFCGQSRCALRTVVLQNADTAVAHCGHLIRPYCPHFADTCRGSRRPTLDNYPLAGLSLDRYTLLVYVVCMYCIATDPSCRGPRKAFEFGRVWLIDNSRPASWLTRVLGMLCGDVMWSVRRGRPRWGYRLWWEWREWRWCRRHKIVPEPSTFAWLLFRWRKWGA